mgnify:CR=1 FL=1
MKLTKARLEAYLVAADVCRNMQRVFAAKTRKSGGAIREMWANHASGAGSCAVELECLSGLTFEQIASRKKVRSVDSGGVKP